MTNDPERCPNCGHDLQAVSRQLLSEAKSLLEQAKAHLEGVEKFGVFVASSSSRDIKHFHRLSCNWAAEIPPHNVVILRSHEEAIEQGYRVCKTCSP